MMGDSRTDQELETAGTRCRIKTKPKKSPNQHNKQTKQSRKHQERNEKSKKGRFCYTQHKNKPR